MATDPVCGMHVDEHKAMAKAVYHGRTYYFCSSDCHEAFNREPAKYAEPRTNADTKPEE